MQNNNGPHDIINMQDTSTQAMTEVALGLSMAFFALLIIALMSVALPAQTPATNASQSKSVDINMDMSQAVRLSLDTLTSGQQASDEKLSVAEKNSQVVLFYWGGQFFDSQKQVVNVQELGAQNDVIVAVDPNISFTHLIQIQNQFSGKPMRLTSLDEQWQQALGNEANTKTSNEK